MNKEFVPYDIALTMKELGFDEVCLGMYFDAEDGVKYTEPTWKFLFGKKADSNNEFEVNAPLYQQALEWFRTKYNVHPAIEFTGSGKFICKMRRVDRRGVHHLNRELKRVEGERRRQRVYHETYEDAMSSVIEACIEAVKMYDNE